MQITNYSESDAERWNAFVASSKNGTFLFNRSYLEYHRDRFHDQSLIVSDERGAIVALLPAHRRGNALISHGGLTYGGFVVDRSMKLPQMLEAFRVLLEHLRSQGLAILSYKTVPWIYHSVPAEEDRYALYLAPTRLTRRGVMAVLARDDRPAFQERRRRGAKKATQAGVSIAQTNDWGAYWALLSDRLEKAYSATPVHSVEEMQLLAARFPKNIKLFGATVDNELIGGVVIFESAEVARAQYIATNEQGQNVGALDLLFSELLSKQYRAKRFFDFGTSDEHGGRTVNRGLIDQKEGYGARVVVQDYYEVDVSATAPTVFADALR